MIEASSSVSQTSRCLDKPFERRSKRTDSSSLSSVLLVSFSIILQLFGCADSIQFWSRLGPLPSDASLGSSCRSSLQCLLYVPNSHCSWETLKCECQPYHVPHQNNQCLPASLLGYGCKINDQCTLKVPNSQCSNGKCECKPLHISIRKDKCLAPAKINDYCLNDDMCSRVTPYSHCKWIIPRVYGKCQCLPDHVFTKDDQQCWPKLHQRCESSMECERATANSYCTSESFVSNRLLTTFSRSLADNVQRAALQSSNTGNGRSSNRKHYHKAMRMSSRSWHRSASRQNNIWSQQDSIPTLYRNHASEGSHCACSDGFEQNESLDACVSNRPSTESPSIELMEEQASSHDRLSVSSLGKSCRSSLECRLRDPHSHCVSGVCQCIVNNGSCSANNTGCHADTFQCKSGECISWYFVCDNNQNCEDGSDEFDCQKHRCPKEAFQCNDGTCLSRSQVCNGHWECPDGSDEARCYKGIACDRKAHKCKSGQCLPQYSFCNAVNDCVDGSDEDEDMCENADDCPKGTFQCTNGKCRSTAILCSGVDGCGDNSDENKCEVCFCPNSNA